MQAHEALEHTTQQMNRWCSSIPSSALRLARRTDSVEAMLVLAVQNLTDGETQLLDDAIAILQRLQRSLERQLLLSRVMQPGMSSFAANLKPRSDVAPTVERRLDCTCPAKMMAKLPRGIRPSSEHLYPIALALASLRKGGLPGWATFEGVPSEVLERAAHRKLGS
jgi:hypothetical protein